MTPADPISRRLIVTMQCDPRVASAFTGPRKESWMVWERRLE
jgi:hypothetical protein